MPASWDVVLWWCAAAAAVDALADFAGLWNPPDGGVAAVGDGCGRCAAGEVGLGEDGGQEGGRSQKVHGIAHFGGWWW